MIYTVNDKAKTITLESSFTYFEWLNFITSLSPEQQKYTFEVGKGKQEWVPKDLPPDFSPITLASYVGGTNPYTITFTGA